MLIQVAASPTSRPPIAWLPASVRMARTAGAIAPIARNGERILRRPPSPLLSRAAAHGRATRYSLPPMVLVRTRPSGLGSSTSAATGDFSGAGYSILSAFKSGTVSGEAAGAVTGAADTAAGILALIPGGQVPAAIVAAIGNALGPVIAMFNGCGQTCVLATQDINQIGAAMTQAFHAYMDAPVHYESGRAAFISYFNQLIAAVKQACGNPQLGQAGRDCISENTDPSACHWKASPGGWNPPNSPNATYTWWGPSGSGTACWNPFVMLNDVINDPTVVPDPVGASVLSSFGVNPQSTFLGVPILDLALPVLLIALGLFI